MEYVKRGKDELQKLHSQIKTFVSNDNHTNDVSRKVVNVLKKVEALTSIKRMHQVYIMIGLVLFIAIARNAFKIITLLVGTIYPSYYSFKAIESSDKSDDTRWLVYWVAFAAFSLIETFTDVILFWFPPYYIVKLIILIGFMWPDHKRNLSYILYYKIIRPLIKKNEKKIDDTVNNVAREVTEAVTSFKTD
eukprot:m.3025 g.3025  ORF g.3025 m.3025 type:complete len:191 (-) comp2007_c0_seq1:925-1497(-)